MEPSSFFISSPDIATSPEIAAGAFIYEPRSGRFFFFQRNISACKDEDHRYCPVCGNLRKAFAADEARRLRLNALLTQAQLQEIDRRGGQPDAVDRASCTQKIEVSTPVVHERAIAADLTSLAAAVQCRQQRVGPIRQSQGVFSIMQGRGPPRG